MDEAGDREEGHRRRSRASSRRSRRSRTRRQLSPLFAATRAALPHEPVRHDRRRRTTSDPENHIANIGQGGLGLPDRDMYDAKNQQFEPLRDGYKKYIAAMLTLLGEKDAEKRAAAIYALEEKIAAVHWTRVAEPRSAEDVQQADDRRAAEARARRRLEVVARRRPASARQTAVNVNQPTAIAGIAKLVKSEPLAVWKDYLTLHLLSEAAPYLSKAFVDTQLRDVRQDAVAARRRSRIAGSAASIRSPARWARRSASSTSTKYFTPATKAQRRRAREELARRDGPAPRRARRG